MNDAEYEAAKARIKRVVDEWHRPLGLRWWRARYEYDRTGEDCRDLEGVRDGYIALAHIDVNWPYMRFRVTWNVPELARIESEDEFEEAVLHELVHVLLDEVAAGDKRDDAHDHLEHTTQTLAKVLRWVRDGARSPTEPGVY